MLYLYLSKHGKTAQCLYRSKYGKLRNISTEQKLENYQAINMIEVYKGNL